MSELEETFEALVDLIYRKTELQNEEKLLRKMDALTTKEKVVKLVAQIEGLNLSAELQSAIAEIAVDTNDSGD